MWALFQERGPKLGSCLLTFFASPDLMISLSPHFNAIIAVMLLTLLFDFTLHSSQQFELPWPLS